MGVRGSPFPALVLGRVTGKCEHPGGVGGYLAAAASLGLLGSWSVGIQRSKLPMKSGSQVTPCAQQSQDLRTDEDTQHDPRAAAELTPEASAVPSEDTNSQCPPVLSTQWHCVNCLPRRTSHKCHDSTLRHLERGRAQRTSVFIGLMSYHEPHATSQAHRGNQITHQTVTGKPQPLKKYTSGNNPAVLHSLHCQTRQLYKISYL